MKKQQQTEDAVMSYEMLKNCKRDIAQYGFDGKEYIKFLISVMAMKNKSTVMKFPISEINEYRDKFIKKNEYSIGDQFQLEKSKTQDNQYFIPRAFWDKVLSSNLN